MYSIEITTEFCASHQLRLPDGSLEPLHGHNWHVVVTVESPTLDALETVMDFHDLQKIVAAAVGGWNNRHLNEIEPFVTAINPSAERVAEMLGKMVAAVLREPVRVASVWVSEASGCRAAWRPDAFSEP